MTFNVITSHISEDFLLYQPTLIKLFNNCIKLYWYYIRSSKSPALIGLEKTQEKNAKKEMLVKK